MPTTATRLQPAGTNSKPHAPAAQDAKAQSEPPNSQTSARKSADSTAKPGGYGLPCAHCRLYYPAELEACPTCHHRERVSPTAPQRPRKQTAPTPDPVPNSAGIDAEREEFLRQFKTQVIVAHSAAVNNSGSACNLGKHRASDDPAATICKACYDRLQERLDVCEACLHMDPKEAAQIIYDAVWADPSDPAKTYENAANALLAEIRKRAGLNSAIAPFRAPSD